MAIWRDVAQKSQMMGSSSKESHAVTRIIFLATIIYFMAEHDH